MENIENLIISLAKKRPIFHSEADFQHAFAWEIQKNYPKANIRLEFPFQVSNDCFHLDICIFYQGEIVAIELKYKTRGLSIQVDGEQFSLKNQSAQDLGRYDFIKDIKRIEMVSETDPNTTGYVIFLTNDSAYWKKPNTRNTVDSEFRIDNGLVLEKEHSWGKNTSNGTKLGREQSIEIHNNYLIEWKDYSHIKDLNYGQFKFLLLKIPIDNK